jgi:hypothetical protein
MPRGDPRLFQRAFEMLLEEEEPADFKWIFPGNSELKMLSKSEESDTFLNEFHSF